MSINRFGPLRHAPAPKVPHNVDSICATIGLLSSAAWMQHGVDGVNGVLHIRRKSYHWGEITILIPSSKYYC